MPRLVIDIETVGRGLDELDPGIRENLLKNAITEDEVREVADSLGLYPITAEIVAIGLYDPDAKKGTVHYQSPGELPLPTEEAGLQFTPGTEAEILTRFWQTVRKQDTIVTFNGRAFDAPFIIIRSAIHHIAPTRELVPNRYDGSHVDLFDRLTFYGAAKRRFGLDAWCRAFGIRSPKEEGVSGADVRKLWDDKRYLDIATYCGRDIKATAELYEYWERYVRFRA